MATQVHNPSEAAALVAQLNRWDSEPDEPDFDREDAVAVRRSIEAHRRQLHGEGW